ncbi:MAG: hypothetical protein IKH89_04515 [Bacteroidales bacterium]|nr:hypothetical protein [Bacteroidales bacterium]
MKKGVFLIAVLALLASCGTSDVSIFEHVEKLCNKDNGKLWGVNLYSPVLGVDSLRNIVSNVPDAPKTFPADKPVANSTTELDGKRWTMILWPLSGDQMHQSIILVHEMFHYRQPELGLWQDKDPNNSHLSNRDARTLLKLEWNALKAAASCDGEQKKTALKDALSFRAQRRHLYPDFAAEENSLEIMEGLAEYTGKRIAIPDNKEYLQSLSDLDYLYESDNLTRSFAYLSGPLYGLILDQSAHPWHKEMNSGSDLGSSAMEIYGITLPENLEETVETAKAKYDFESIDAAEEAFQRKLEERNETLRKLFAPDNVITLECPNLSIQFSPDSMIKMDDGSMVIYGCTAFCDWGSVEGHPLKVTADWRRIELPRLDTLSFNNDTITTSGWTLIKKNKHLR